METVETIPTVPRDPPEKRQCPVTQKGKPIVWPHPPNNLLTCLVQLNELLIKNPNLGTTCNRRCICAFNLQWTDPTPLPTPPITLRSSLEGNMSRQICVTSTLGSTWIVSIDIKILPTDPARSRKTLSNLPRTK